MIALTEFHYNEVLFDLSVTVSAIFNNYSSSPNGLLTWAIDSEAMRARGIIVLVKSN